MDVIEYIQSEKGKPKLKYKGYLYIYQKSLADNRHSWECEFRRKNLCKARIQVTHDDQYHGQINEHTHTPNIAKIEADTVIANIKHRARTTYETPQQIITECLASSNPACAPLLPAAQTMRREARRIRKNSRPPLPKPTCAADVVIPRGLQITYSNEVFLFHDDQGGNNRTIIFASQNGINLLQNSRFWACDGTFKTCPEVFYQLYSIHATCEYTGQVYPCVYALLTSKRQGTYRSLLDRILANGQGPQEVIMDFELAARNAFESKFPGVDVQFCFYRKVSLYCKPAVL